MMFNMALNSETAHVGVSTFSTLLVISSSVCVYHAQFRIAQR